MVDTWYDNGGELPPANFLWVTAIDECSIKYYQHDEHDILMPDLTTIYCPGAGVRYENE